MGIFERSIPKYTYNLANEVVVEPQDVYVDDIFDPILNARVKDAMRQKYGEGLYGVMGGYEELLKNTWTGDHGILGPGMGVLSTFGRSMDKADDIILGALTEGIKAMSGQGAVNPITNIFTNDHDYTGRGLLAATANVGRNLVGASVDESDFGSAWTLPSLGIELATDVGILGGSVARKFAPEAAKLTSKQLFENLGKSDFKTSVGTIGQLMSNYDDLMAKVAIDISAPGLRPAFKALMNKIASIIPHNAPQGYADVTILKSNPELRKAAKDYYTKDELYQLLLRIFETSKKIPKEEAVENVAKKVDDVVAEVGEDTPLNKMLYIKNLLESDAYAQLGDEVNTELSNVAHTIRLKDEAWQKEFNEKAGKTISRLEEKVGRPVKIGTEQSDLTYDSTIASLDDAIRATKELDIDQLQTRADFLEEEYLRTGLEKYERQAETVRDSIAYINRARTELDELRQIVLDATGIYKTPSQKFTAPAFEEWFAQKYPDFKDLSRHDQQRILNDIRHDRRYAELQDEYNKLFDAKRPARIASGGRHAEQVLNAQLSKESANKVNATYVDEILEKLDDDEKLLDALLTGEWTTNTAANNAINAALGNPSYKERVWYSKANSKFRSSPSRLSKLQAYGTEGTSYAYAKLDAIRYAFRNPNDVRFSNEAELDAFLDSDNMVTAFTEFFPIDYNYITRQAKKAGKDISEARDAYFKSQYEKFKKAVKDVYFPKPKKNYKTVTVGDYTRNLETLSAILDKSKMRSMSYDVLSKVPNESMFLEELYRAFDDVGDDGVMRGIDQVYLQPLRNEPRMPKSSKRMASTRIRSHQEVQFDDSTGQKIKQQVQDLYDPDRNVGLADDYSTSIVKYMQSILSQYAPQIKSDEDLRYIIEPLLDYMQFTPGNTVGKVEETAAYLSRVTGISKDKFTKDPELRKLLSAELSRSRLEVSASTKATVSEFKSNVLPKLQTYVNMGINPLDGRNLSRAPWEDFNDARALLGFNVKDSAGNLVPKHANGYANRLMFQAIWNPRLPGHKYTSQYGSEGWKFDLRSTHTLDYALEDAAMRANLSQAKLETPEFKPADTVSHIFDSYRTRMGEIATAKPKSSKIASEVVDTATEAMVKAGPEDAAKLAYEVPSFSEADVEDVLKELLGDEAYKFYKDGGDPGAFKALYGEDSWNLTKQIARASAVPSTNSFRKTRATLRTNRAKDILSRVFKLRGRILLNHKFSDFRRFVILRQQTVGDVLQGKDFWNEFRKAGAFHAVYAEGSKEGAAVLDSLTKNANIINKAVNKDVVRVTSEALPNSKFRVSMEFIGDKKLIVNLNGAADAIEKAAFETVVFSPPKALTGEDLIFMNSSDMRELSALLDEVQELAADQAKYLGFQFDTMSPYTKHAMNRNPTTASWFTDTFYKDISSEDLDEIVNSISNLDRYRKTDRGAFGTTVTTRRFRGDTWMMDDGPNYRFNYDPYEMVTSTLADGTFANLQFQSYVDLFINDNYKIRPWFKTVDDLKKVLYATLEDGKPSGNLRNLELCTMKLDANGRIVGLTKYDKMSDAGLAKALADENCILVPTNAVSHLDNLLKKDIRMSNKLWTFVNRHFTIPFKFGVLSNPGFLLGNLSDSYLKLATTMSQKYGTTVTAEAARVAGCIKRAEQYKEAYLEAFDVWRKVSKEHGIMLSPEATIPDIVAMSPKYNEQFMDWLAGRLTVDTLVKDETGAVKTLSVEVPCDISDYVKNASSTWVTLQTAQMRSSKLREFAELADLENVSKFEMPTTAWDRILQGKGKYDAKRPSTWGLFMNNPATRAMLDASEGWEDVIRTASILDDLEHGYTLEELGAFTRANKWTEDDIKFKARLDEAKNAMYNAQFDYERGSDFMEGVGKVIPFPIFFLKNFVYWMELFMQNPQYVDNAIDIQEGLWSDHEQDDEFAMQAKGRGAVPVGGDNLPDWFKGIYKPTPLQSMFGAFSLLNSPTQDLAYRVNPLISGATSVVAKAHPTDLTTYFMPAEETKYRPYSTNMYERNIKASDPNFNPLEYAIHRANPYERAINTYLRTPNKIREGEAQLSDFLPSVFQPDF